MKWYKYLSFVLISCFCLSLFSEELYVFVPTGARAKTVQNDISSSCPNINVTVFGRGKDFRQKVKEANPDAILSVMPVLDNTEDYSMVLRGQHSGSFDENYVLVSIDNPLDLKSLGDKKIGVVDLLGRKPMSEFVSQLFKTEVKLKRVTKQEDLLPLLTFGSADGIFVSERLFQDIKSNSNLNLVATPLNIKVGLVGTALSGKAAKDNIVKCIHKFSDKVNKTLGVDKWHSL